MPVRLVGKARRPHVVGLVICPSVDGKNSQSNKQLAAATAHTAELHEKSPDVQEQSQDLEKLDDVNQWKGEMKGKEKENSRRLEVFS